MTMEFEYKRATKASEFEGKILYGQDMINRHIKALQEH